MTDDSLIGLAEKGEEFLEHFGVKGMKWGVRKDRNRAQANMVKQSEQVAARQQLAQLNPGLTRAQYNNLNSQDLVIPRGSVLKRITRDPNADTGFESLFVSANEADARNYRAQVPLEATGWQVAKKYDGFYETTLEVRRDLKGPSEKARVDAYVDLMRNPVVDGGNGRAITGKQFLKERGLDIGNEEDFVLANYSRLTATQGIRDDPLNKGLMTTLKNKGYNALVDDNDRGKLADQPLLILDAKSALKTVEVRALTTADIHDAQATFTPPREDRT